MLPHSAARIRENAECQSDRADNGARVRVAILTDVIRSDELLEDAHRLVFRLKEVLDSERVRKVVRGVNLERDAVLSIRNERSEKKDTGE